MLQVGPERVGLSIVVAAELRYGAVRKKSSRLSTHVAATLLEMAVLPLEQPVDEAYADIRSTLERAGTPIGPNDLFIAAHALALDLTLVTANVREFSRVPGLRVENWLD
jgi:tRNA(fMet)-specific endonuclease VapC